MSNVDAKSNVNLIVPYISFNYLNGMFTKCDRSGMSSSNERTLWRRKLYTSTMLMQNLILRMVESTSVTVGDRQRPVLFVWRLQHQRAQHRRMLVKGRCWACRPFPQNKFTSPQPYLHGRCGSRKIQGNSKFRLGVGSES